MMIQDPKLCEELDTMRREIGSLEEIVRQKRNALEKIRLMIRKKESLYQRDKKKFMNTTGTWVADMNLKKMATKNTIMQKKLSSAKRKANMLQAQEIKIKLHIDDLRREKNVFEDAFKRMSRDVEILQGLTENLQNQLEEAEKDTSVASNHAKCCQDEYLKQSKEIRNQIRRLDKKIYNKRRKKKRYMSGKDVVRNEDSKKTDEKNMSSSLKKHLGLLDSSLEDRKQWWITIKEKTNVDSVDKLLNDFREFEETKMRKLMEANELILELEKLREEKKIAKKKEEGEHEEDTASHMKRHADIVDNIRLQTKKKKEAMRQIMSQIESHHSLAKSIDSFVKSLRSIVDNKQLIKRVENALGVSKMAFDVSSYSSSSSSLSKINSSYRIKSMKTICENLGRIQSQVMLIMQFYTANLVDGSVGAGTPKQRLEVLAKTGPQYEHGSTKKCMDRTRETVPGRIETQEESLDEKTTDDKHSSVRPLTNDELRQVTMKTMDTSEEMKKSTA